MSEVNTQAAARDALQNYSRPRPPEWLEQNGTDLQLIGDAGRFSEMDSYVATHRQEALAETAPWIDSADLSHPRVALPANDPIIVSAWDGTADGVGTNTCLPGFGSEYDCQMPGAHKEDATIVVERLDGFGDVVSRSTVEPDQVAGEGLADPDRFHYTTLELQAGFYRLYEEGAATKGPVRLVGSPSSFIQQNLNNVNDSLSEQSSSVQNALDAGDLSRMVTTTDDNGEYTLSPPSQAKLVTVQAIKAPGMDTDPSNLDTQTVNDEYNSALETMADDPSALSDQERRLLNSSIYYPTSTQTVDPPASGVDIEVYEVSTPPVANITAQQERLEDLRDQLRNETFANLPSALQERLGSVDRERLEDLHAELDRLRENNERLESRYDELLDEYLSEDASVDVDVNDTSTGDLRNRIQALQQAMTELRSTIETGESSVTSSTNTVTYRQRFGAPLDAEDISVVAHWSNGTSEVVDEQYVTVDGDIENVAGTGGSEVVVSEFPIGENDPQAVQFEIRGANGEGLAKAQQQVKNPTFEGELPSLRAISLSSLEPGPNQQVTMEVDPGPESTIQRLESVTVYGPDGTQITPGNITDGTRVGFQTAGAGVYHIEATLVDTSGNQFQTTVHVQAGRTDTTRPASVRAKDSPLGVYAVVGDGLASGDIELQQGGSQATVVGQISQDADIPDRVHVYLESLSLSANTETSVRVVRGVQQEAVSRHVPITMHLPRLPEDAQVWRNGDPIPEEGTQWGQTTRVASATTVETYTDGSGAVTITTEADPGLISQAQYFAEVQLAGLSDEVPFLVLGTGGVPGSLPTPPTTATLGGVPAFAPAARPAPMSITPPGPPLPASTGGVVAG